jgi:hypothetical protein
VKPISACSIESIIKVCERLAASPELIEELRQARSETQFKSAVEKIKHGLPDTLLIQGTQPSNGTSWRAQQRPARFRRRRMPGLARDVRIVLVDMAERISTALADRREVDEAAARLIRRASAKSEK